MEQLAGGLREGGGNRAIGARSFAGHFCYKDRFLHGTQVILKGKGPTLRNRATAKRSHRSVWRERGLARDVGLQPAAGFALLWRLPSPLLL